jgi:hypothetical protein
VTDYFGIGIDMEIHSGGEEKVVFYEEELATSNGEVLAGVVDNTF